MFLILLGIDQGVLTRFVLIYFVLLWTILSCLRHAHVVDQMQRVTWLDALQCAKWRKKETRYEKDKRKLSGVALSAIG